MNIYEIEMKFEGSTKNKGANLLSYEKLMSEKAVDQFNKDAKKARNPKKITEVVVYADKCKIVLESNERLTSPAKSIRAYTSFLLENGMSKFAKDNALFRSTSIKEVKKELDDECLITLIVHSVLSKKKADKEFISRVKELARDMNMIS